MPAKLRALTASKLSLLAIVIAAGGLAVFYSTQATQWAVMTDELQTAKLATSIARTLSPAPRIHGEHYGGLNQLYPFVLAPFYGLLSAPAAFRAAHVLNAFLLASSAWPAYILGREVTRSRAGGYFAASLTAFMPWLVLSSTLLTENIAYPAFVWGVLAGYRALIAPSFGRDASALAGLALVFVARAELFVLAVALPIALLGHELGFAAASAGRQAKLAALRDACRRAVASHRLLAFVYWLGGISALLLAAFDSLPRVFGTYSTTLRGNPLPAGIWHSAAVHLDDVVVGVGVAPFVLAAAWAIGAVLRPLRRESHAFAVLFLVLVPLVTLEAASFDLRFTPGKFVQDRYLCYLVPLLAVGAAAALVEHRLLSAAFVPAVGVSFFWLAGFASYSRGTVLYWASPAAAFDAALGSAAGAIGLTADDFVRWGALLVSVVLAAALWRVPSRVTLAVVGAGVTAFGAFEAVYVFDRFSVPGTTRPQTIVGVRRDWIDAALPDGASVALVPDAELSPEYWWDAEFWNETVDRALRIDRQQTFTPFPATSLAFDRDTGRVYGRQPTDLLVLDSTETRFRLLGTAPLATARPLTLVRVAKPYRAAWLVEGLEPDGWAHSGRPVQIRLFASRGGRRRLVLNLRASSEASTFVLRSGGVAREGLVRAARTGRVRLTVCVPSGGFGSATLVTHGGPRLPDGSATGLHVDRVETRSQPGRCR